MIMVRFILFLILFIGTVLSSNSQVLQSDTGYLWNNTNSSLKVFSYPFKGDYFIYRSPNGATKNFIKPSDGSIQFHDSLENPYRHSYQPTGRLIIDDSTFFIVGSLSTFSDEGVILKSTDSGKNWSVKIYDKHYYSGIKSKSMYFFTDSLGLVLFKATTEFKDNTTYFVALTIDQGKTWETQEIENIETWSLQYEGLNIEGKIDESNPYQPLIKGKYKIKESLDWTSF